MWVNTWPRPTPEERSMAPIDEGVNQAIADILATGDVTEDMIGPIYAIVFESELAHESGATYYAYRYWLGGIAELHPIYTWNFCESLVGTRDGLLLGDDPVTVTVEDVAAFLEQRYGHAPVSVRQYAVEPTGARLVAES